MNSKLLAILVFALFAIKAKGEDFRTRIDTINQAISELGDKLDQWDGSYQNATPVLTQTYTINSLLTSPLSTESSGDKEKEQEGIEAAKKLADNVGRIVGKVVAKKAQMEALPLKGIGKRMFGMMQASADKLSQNYENMATPENQQAVRDVAQEIKDHFSRTSAALFS